MEIVKAVSNNPEIIKFMLENLEEAEVFTTDEAQEKIGSRVAAGQARNTRRRGQLTSWIAIYCPILVLQSPTDIQKRSS